MNPSGPLPVGVVDISATDAGAGVERLAARLFYPCSRSWSFPCTWISHINYARGYVGYLFKFVTQKTWRTELAKAALTSAACVLGNSRLLPVYYNAPVAPLKATAADGDAGLLPVVIFSHGLAGTRNTYSSICIELASRGYMVMALEHSDGSASVARLPRLPSSTSLPPTATATCAAPSSPEVIAASRKPSCARSSNPVDGRDVGNGITSSGSNGSSSGGSSGSTRGGSSNSGGGNGSEWCFYGGLGDKPEQLRKTRHRVAEVAAAYELLRRLHEGRAGSPESASNSTGAVTDTTNNTTTDKTINASSSSSTYPAWCELPPGLASTLVGRLDLGRVAVVGHSYGGATAAAAVAELPFLRAAVSLDPWWDCYDPLWPVLSTWTNPHAPPLLVVGSEDWNSPNSEGKLKCGGPNRDRVLAAAAASGGGAVMVVPRGSTHVNFDDIMLLYGKSLSAVLRMLGLRSSLEPRRAHHINMWCILHFLATHMPPPPSPVDPTTPNDLSSTHDGGGPTSDKDVAMPVRHESLQPYKDAVGQWSAELVMFPRGGGGAPGDAVAYE